MYQLYQPLAYGNLTNLIIHVLSRFRSKKTCCYCYEMVLLILEVHIYLQKGKQMTKIATLIWANLVVYCLTEHTRWVDRSSAFHGPRWSRPYLDSTLPDLLPSVISISFYYAYINRCISIFTFYHANLINKVPSDKSLVELYK